ncbi:hypothetical protein, partial [Campylobacter coli]|uniref:hypothetical protein n=1 Tax=Campylobacter coli TaxID=195 RepID=UPI001E38149F
LAVISPVLVLITVKVTSTPRAYAHRLPVFLKDNACVFGLDFLHLVIDKDFETIHELLLGHFLITARSQPLKKTMNIYSLSGMRLSAMMTMCGYSAI